MTFRPYPGLTIAALIAITILVGLGVWQLQRLQWKLALIADVTAHMAAPAIGLDQALHLSADAVQYRKVTLQGRFDNAHEAYVFATAEGGAPVYHVLTPFRVDDGRVLMVDRGAVPMDRMDQHARIEGETSVTGIWRVPDGPGAFTPPPQPEKHIWYARDLAGISRAAHVTLAAPVVIEAVAAQNPGGFPKGGQTVVSFTNNHLSYAVTWFGLAAGLFGVYLAYHISRGRFRREQ